MSKFWGGRDPIDHNYDFNVQCYDQGRNHVFKVGWSNSLV